MPLPAECRRGRIGALFAVLALLAACAGHGTIGPGGGGGAPPAEPAPRPPPAAREEARPIPYASRHLLPLPACPTEIREDCVVLEEPWNYAPSDVAQAGTDLIGAIDPLVLRPESGLFLLALEIYQAGIRFLVEEPDTSHVDELLRRIESDVLVTALLLRQMAGTVDI